jgi:cyclophilin family peptidyl-prolyl cis-trans isomerase
MARRPDQADSSTCQFFFNLVDNPHLDHRSRQSAQEYGYCVFGRVVEGIEVLEKMNHLSVEDEGEFSSVPTPAIVIERIRTDS